MLILNNKIKELSFKLENPACVKISSNIPIGKPAFTLSSIINYLKIPINFPIRTEINENSM